MPELQKNDSELISVVTGTRSRKKKPGALFSMKNRFTLLALLIMLSFAVMIIRTSSLQLFGGNRYSSPETWGSVTSISIAAPRGDIVERNGLPLAVNDTLNAISLVQTGMDDNKLNRMLLDLALLFRAYGCAFESPLLSWFDVDAFQRGSDLLSGGSALRFVFRKPYDDIVRWQTDRDLFNLVESDKAVTAYEKNRVVRDDPMEFFRFLLFDFFKIEPDRSTGSRLYSDGEAFTIMQLRYLLLENNWIFMERQPVIIAENAPEDLAAYFTEQNYRFPGVIVTRQYRRRYTDDSRYVGHALGYVGAISSAEYNMLKPLGYAMNSVIGKSGVEQAAERYLCGRSGIMSLESWEADANGGSILYPSEVSRIPIAGNEVKMTIDMGLQKVARDELERKIMEFRGSESRNRTMKAPEGCVIVLDAKTGAVLANANYPDYDPSDFVGQFHDPEAAKRVQELISDQKTMPLINRGISAIYTPGSTFKPVTGMAALEAGTITTQSNIRVCRGEQDIGGYTWHCSAKDGHGPLTFKQALVASCNLYFYQIGVETGIDKIEAMAKRLGLGEYSGVDLSGEVSGIRPSRELKKKINPRAEDQHWFFSDTCQTSIGQFYNSYTMLQMARAVCGLVTNQLVTPHFIKEVTGQDGLILVPEQIDNEPLGLNENNVRLLRDAMVGLTASRSTRTGILFGDFPYRVGCKTGTAEAFSSEMEPITNSVFVCFAPADDPQIVIAHAISDGAFGAYSADISYRILCKYFGVSPTHTHMGNYDDYISGMNAH